MTGEDASLVIDLGCIKEINGLYIKNFHNSYMNNRGTEYFSIYVKYNESNFYVFGTSTYYDVIFNNLIN